MRIDEILLEYGGYCSQQVEATDDDKQFHKAKQEIAKLIKETLQECIGNEEPEEEFTKSGVNLAVVKGNTTRNQLRQEALNKLDSLLGDNNA